MLKFINISEFMRYLFDDEGQVLKAAKIIRALLKAQSPRLSNIAEQMEGKSDSCYKVIQRFIARTDIKRKLLRLFQEEAEFVLGDPKDLLGERPLVLDREFSYLELLERLVGEVWPGFSMRARRIAGDQSSYGRLGG